MKKLFLAVFGIFALVIALSFQTNNNNFVLNTAFACTPCNPETSSVCDSGGGILLANQYKKSCSKSSLQNNLTP
jgi:transcription elongation factor Elf1